MFTTKHFLPRRFVPIVVLATSLTLLLPGPIARAATDDETAESGSATSSAVSGLISRLAERGVLSKQDAVELNLLAEADAAELAAQKAMTKAALAQAAAAQARARALQVLAEHRRPAAEPAPSLVAPVNRPPPPEEEPVPEPAVVRKTVRSLAQSHQPGKVKAPSHASEPPAELPAELPAAESVASEPEPAVTEPAVAEPAAAEPADATPAPRHSLASKRARPPQAAEPAESLPDDVVRVTYVPESVKVQLREEIKQDVMQEAREENWAAPNAFPDWVTKIRLFGDLRVRYEATRYPAGNDNTGAFPNFNAINTGAPFDTAGTIFSPQLNVDQNRSRARLRARFGAAVDLGQNYSTGLRLATGENNSPVTQNQSFGAAGSGQGGNFSKYAVWLDRAFLKYELGGLPDKDLTLSAGRFDNPFLSTSVVWADDIGFDGAVTQGRYGFGEDLTTFFAAGVFPIFNTDLNFASNQPAKFKSSDRWLDGAQIGLSWEPAKDVAVKFGAAYYQFTQLRGKKSTAFVPYNSTDAGDTDARRPSFAQKGNTYMALRNITPVAGDPAAGGNQNGTVNQFQYFGLASNFNVLSLDTRIDFNHFEPFQISLIAEYNRNLAWDKVYAQTLAVNNRGAATTEFPAGLYLGSDTAWLVGLSVGDVTLEKPWSWNLTLNYRNVGSDAVVDGFNDSDFGGGGTNVKGFTFGGNLALSHGTKLGLRWLSSSQVVGPVFKNDIIQLDFSGKF